MPLSARWSGEQWMEAAQLAKCRAYFKTQVRAAALKITCSLRLLVSAQRADNMIQAP